MDGGDGHDHHDGGGGHDDGHLNDLAHFIYKDIISNYYHPQKFYPIV